MQYADDSVYKCYIDVGNPKKCIGHINNPCFLKSKFYLSDIKISNKCYDCSLFPICNGSCPKKISTLCNNKNEHCHIAKGYKKKFLKFYLTTHKKILISQ
ncbi:MAG: SPASM domain-containing protein [Prevotellaceae bacterium]|nr:SPASM domain-containing protein [Prevotellaceae bacterium]